jgi:hypothetical protein
MTSATDSTASASTPDDMLLVVNFESTSKSVSRSMKALVLPAVLLVYGLSSPTADASANPVTNRVFQVPSVNTSDDKAIISSANITVADRVVVELIDLDNDWAGPDSVRPSDQVVRDIEKVLDALPLATRDPLIEIEEDGSVSLRWIDIHRSKSLSLIFRGNSRVSVVAATISPPRSRTWSAVIDDETKLFAILDECGSDEFFSNNLSRSVST